MSKLYIQWRSPGGLFTRSKLMPLGVPEWTTTR
jgi:hypothetical protein